MLVNTLASTTQNVIPKRSTGLIGGLAGGVSESEGQIQELDRLSRVVRYSCECKVSDVPQLDPPKWVLLLLPPALTLTLARLPTVAMCYKRFLAQSVGGMVEMYKFL